MKCCNKLIKPKRFSFCDDDGLKIVKIGYCTNPKCAIPVLEIETASLFGRAQKQVLRGKRAEKYLEENRYRLLINKRYKQYKKNTAKGFHYSQSLWDLVKNELRIETKELSTDRLIKREVLNIKQVTKSGCSDIEFNKAMKEPVLCS